MYKKAEFSPCGPEPNWCYVTDTSHPDVELTRKFTAVQWLKCGLWSVVERFFMRKLSLFSAKELSHNRKPNWKLTHNATKDQVVVG